MGVIKMIKQVLTANMDDDESASHAAKLLEIIVLQCQQQIENVIFFIDSFF